jgi:AraC-like DNA-binding protein
MAETRGIRLRRLSAAERASHDTWQDDVSALHDECREAESDGWTVRDIARVIEKSPAHTHRIMARLTGPNAA